MLMLLIISVIIQVKQPRKKYIIRRFKLSFSQPSFLPQQLLLDCADMNVSGGGASFSATFSL